MQKRKPGDIWEVVKRGVTYLAETQPTGKAKIIKRITPYVAKNKANGKSTLEDTKRVIQPKIKAEKPSRMADKVVDESKYTWVYDTTRRLYVHKLIK